MERFNWFGKALVELRNVLEAEIIASKYSGNLFREQEPLIVPTTADLCTSALSAVKHIVQLHDGDLHTAAQLFNGESHVQQAAFSGMDESGSILQPDHLGAPLKKVKDSLQANTGASCIREKRPRPTGDQLQNKGPNGFVKKTDCNATIACLTCLKARDDDCKVCKVYCACCTCVPRKEFAKCAHLYAAAPAEDQPVGHVIGAGCSSW